MSEDQLPPISATDENTAPYMPSDATAVCYHCPNTTCDGHHYISPRDLGRQQLICPKCGLAVRISKGAAASWFRYRALLIIGVIIGFVATVLFR